MDDTELLHKAINSAKNFENFPDVLMAISLHPEWLIIIPEGRMWAILHQIILSGDVTHLDQLLALQKSNKSFRLLTETRDKKTILDIAALRPDVPVMIKRLQQLIKLDEMLSYAKECEWEQCYSIVKENPNFVNEKPPYRRFYLIHHMACDNAIKQFESFRQIPNCRFDLNLRADRKKINVIAREETGSTFADYIEKEYPGLLINDDPTMDELYKPTEEAIKHTKVINAIIEQRNVVRDLDQNLMGESFKPKSRHEVMLHISDIRTAHDREQKKASKEITKDEEEKRKDAMRDLLMCPLTLAIFIDPMIAADGFTYECLAITKWLLKNDRSPMTNQQLANKNLNPNVIVKQIVDTLRAT